jgi:predicted RND superfamily exporter protein
MLFIYGLLTAVVFFLVLFSIFYLGYRTGKKNPSSVPVSDERKREMEKFDKHFKNLFNYDVGIAVQRKKVT